MSVRNYSSTAVATTLSASCGSSDTSVTVSSTSGYPTAPFVIIIDRDTASEEAVLVGSVVGLTLGSLTRGYDSTIATSHAAAATVEHGFIALEAREANTHVNATSPSVGSPIHGMTSDFVSEDGTQVLDNKTFQHASSTGAPCIVKGASGQTDTILAIQDSGGTENAGFTPAGRLATPGVDGADTSTFTAGSASTIPLIAKGAASQTANLISAQDSTSTEVFTVATDGAVSAADVTATGEAAFTASAATDVPVTAQGASSQTANLFEAQNSASTVLAKVDASGVVTGTGLVASSSGLDVTGGATIAGATGVTGAVTITGDLSVAGGDFSVTGQARATADAAATIPLLAKGAASQTGDLTQWQDSTASVKASVSSSGLGGFNNPILRIRRNAAITPSSGTLTTITWDTAVTDPFSMYSGTTITIPVDGFYLMGFFGNFSTTFSDYSRVYGAIYLNGTGTIALDDRRVSGMTGPGFTVVTAMPLSAGNTIVCQVLQNNSASASRYMDTDAASPVFWLAYSGSSA